MTQKTAKRYGEDMTSESKLNEMHARNLIKNSGACHTNINDDAGNTYVMHCDICFIRKLYDKSRHCRISDALRHANMYLREYVETTKCKDIW